MLRIKRRVCALVVGFRKEALTHAGGVGVVESSHLVEQLNKSLCRVSHPETRNVSLPVHNQVNFRGCNSFTTGEVAEGFLPRARESPHWIFKIFQSHYPCKIKELKKKVKSACMYYIFPCRFGKTADQRI